MNYTRRNAMALIGAAATVAGTSPASAKDVKKVGFVLNGTPGDVGWNYEHMRGIEMARSVFGDTVQIDTFFDVGEWGKGDADQFIELAIDGYDLVFACSFGYAQSVLQIAVAAPHMKFEHCGGYVRSGNMSTYSTRWYEGRVPQGLIAGAMTKSNKIGYLASFPIPQVIRGINAAHHAARQVNPDVEFEVKWLNSWFSPEKEEDASRALAASGADVLLAHTNSTKPVEVAQELGLHAFGQASDMSAYGADACLSASINNWGPYYVSRIADFVNGTWDSANTWGGFDEGMLAVGDIAEDVPERIVSAAKTSINGMTARKAHPFVGPISRQDGSSWLADGEVATDMSLETMNFYLEGMGSAYPVKA